MIAILCAFSRVLARLQAGIDAVIGRLVVRS
jgi:hypothetical protein